MLRITPNDMLMSLSQIWLSCASEYPEADLEAILKHIESLQLIIFGLEKY